MGSRKLKEAFEVDAKYGAFYTGGQIEWTSDGQQLLCQCGGVIKVLDIEQGKVTKSVGLSEGDEESNEDTINTFVLSLDNEQIISNHRSGLFKLWQWRDGNLLKQWKSVHKGPVSQLCFNEDSSLLASGGTDSNVRIWDLQHQTCTHNLRGAQGVISVVQFNDDLVFAAGDDAAIRAWNYSTGKQQMILSGHYSKVTALVFHHDTNQLVSCGRDRVVILWDLSSGTTVRTLPVFESLEGLVLLPHKFKLPGHKKVKMGIHVATAGERGLLRVWEVTEGHEVFTQNNSLVSKVTEDGGLAIVRLLFNAVKSSLAVISADHNIIVHQLESFSCEKQLVGFSDEVLDIVLLGTGDSYLAVATNSMDIKLYSMKDMGCQLLRGHTDLVLTLAVTPSNPYLLLSGAKDNSVRLWLMDPESHDTKCVGVGSRHTLSVGSVAFSQLSASFFLSVSQDSCLKLWKLPKKFNSDEVQILNVDLTEVAHDKDINSVSVSPNDKLIATGSQDKTAKLWSVEGLALLGVLRGHRRGVWCVRFSPVDQVLLSSSADCSIKLWALGDLTCIKTLEGHDSSVLRAEFMSNSMQLVTAGADGLLKLWNVKTSECMATFDDHDGRIWALAVTKDESLLISGGSDSNLVLWRDVTEKRREETEEARKKLILQEQELANLVKSDQLLSALKLALSLERPLQVLRIIQEVLKQGREGLQDTVRQLESDQKEALLKSATVWNCNSKNCQPAQLVISILLDDLSSGALKIQAFSSTIEGTLPYTERHFKRLTQLLQDLHLLQYMAACMQPQLQGRGGVLNQ